MDFLTEATGTKRFVLTGICSGARDALRTAVADERVVGAVLIDGFAYRTPKYFLRYYGPRLIRLRTWAGLLSTKHPRWQRLGKTNAASKAPSEETEWPTGSQPAKATAAAALAAVAKRGLHLCVIHSGGWQHLYNYREQFTDAFRAIEFGDRLRLEYLKNADHTFTLLNNQASLVDITSAWMCNTFLDTP
jgi:pimeloyl-ACP methyl ester carboxylesterase